MTTELKLIAVQHNKLIEAKYSLTLQEKRIIMFMTSQIDQRKSGFNKQRLAIKDLAQFIGLENNKNIYRQVADITRKLLGKTLEIEYPEDKRLLQLNWLSSADYHYGEGYVILGFSQDMAPYLLALKRQFTQMRLDVLLSLSSIYAIRLYELLKQYQNIGIRAFDLENLRGYLGIEKHEYLKYSHFKLKVIAIALREINDKTELDIQFDEIKTGRKVTRICFTINTKASLPANLLPDSQVDGQRQEPIPIEIPDELIKKLLYFGLSKLKIHELVYTYSLDTVQTKLKDFEEAVESGKTIKNPAGWLVSALEKAWNYKSSYQHEQEQKEREESERLDRERQAAAEQAKREALLKTKRSEFDKFIRELFLSRWSVLPSALQGNLVAQANLNDAQRRSYTQNGVEKSPSSMAKLMQLLLKEHELDFGKWLESNPI